MSGDEIRRRLGPAGAESDRPRFIDALKACLLLAWIHTLIPRISRTGEAAPQSEACRGYRRNPTPLNSVAGFNQVSASDEHLFELSKLKRYDPADINGALCTPADRPSWKSLRRLPAAPRTTGNSLMGRTAASALISGFEIASQGPKLTPISTRII